MGSTYSHKLQGNADRDASFLAGATAGSLSCSFLPLSALHMLSKPPACHFYIWDLVPTPCLVPLCGISFAHSDPRRDSGHLFAALCLFSESSYTTRSLFSSHPLLRFAGESGTEACTQVECLLKVLSLFLSQYMTLCKLASLDFSFPIYKTATVMHFCVGR